MQAQRDSTAHSWTDNNIHIKKPGYQANGVLKIRISQFQGQICRSRICTPCTHADNEHQDQKFVENASYHQITPLIVYRLCCDNDWILTALKNAVIEITSLPTSSCREH